MANFTNNYVLEYVPDNLKWCGRDGVMTYIDKLKYDNFIKNTDEHFEKTQVRNFDINRKQVRGEKINGKLVLKYKAIDNSRIDFYPDKEKEKALSSTFRCSRKDLFFEKKFVVEEFDICPQFADDLVIHVVILIVK